MNINNDNIIYFNTKPSYDLSQVKSIQYGSGSYGIKFKVRNDPFFELVGKIIVPISKVNPKKCILYQEYDEYPYLTNGSKSLGAIESSSVTQAIKYKIESNNSEANRSINFPKILLKPKLSNNNIYWNFNIIYSEDVTLGYKENIYYIKIGDKMIPGIKYGQSLFNTWVDADTNFMAMRFNHWVLVEFK